MPDINENDYQYAEDLPVEDHTTLDGSEKFVMFDSESGKQASLSEVAAYMDDHLDAGNKINTIKVDGTALVPDANKAVNIDLSGKVDKVTGKGLSTNDYTNTEKNKLGDIEAEANKTIVDAELDGESSNPVENQAVTAELERLDERKAEIDGYYEEMTVGNSEELVSSVFINDSVPYNFRTSGGSIDIGNRETDQLVGGTVAWNQMAKVDVSGYTLNGVTFTNDPSKEYFTIDGTATANTSYQFMSGYQPTPIGHVFLICGYKKVGSNTGFMGFAGLGIDRGNGGIWKNTTTYDALPMRIDVMSGDAFSNTKIYPIFINLTKMFGPTIADYIYSLEQATAGAGVAWFRKLFPKSYYAYNAGELMSVNASAHKMTGFNQWDASNDNQGRVLNNDGTLGTNNSFATSDYIKVVAGATYYFKDVASSANANTIAEYDGNKTFIRIQKLSGSSGASVSGTKTMSENTSFIRVVRFRTSSESCINLSWDGERDGEYEPYELHEYALDPIQLRGIPKLDEFNNLYYDGDIYSSDGTVERKYGIVDLGTLNWNYLTDYNVNRFSVALTDLKATDIASIASELRGVVVGFDNPFIGRSIILGDLATETANYDKIIWSYSNSLLKKFLTVKDTAYTDAASFKTAMSGVYLVYELATPATEQADPYTNPQIVNDFGTEEYVDYGVEQGTRDVAIPVGHNTKYMANLRAKLEMAPNSPDGDGDYILRQSSGQNTYVELDPILAEAIATKAEQDGYYESMTVGNAEQLVSTIFEEDQTPYQFRTSGGSLDIGDREYMDAVVGGTVAWNQMIPIPVTSKSLSSKGVTITDNRDGSYTFYTDEGGATGNTSLTIISESNKVIPNHVYLLVGSAEGASSNKWYLADQYNGVLTYLYRTANICKPSMANLAKLDMRIVVISGAIITTPITVRPQVFDLTQMFGTTIADYIYSLEQATTGAGVAWFRKLFPKDYYPYNAGELLSVEGLTSHDMVGFNQWDGTGANGQYWADNGTTSIFNTNSRTEKIRIIGGVSYYFFNPECTITAKFFTENMMLLAKYDVTRASTSRVLTAPSDACYVCINFGQATKPTEFCINIHWDGERDGEYEPYTKHSYPLDSSLTLRGIPKLDASNNLYFDGDQYAADGTVTRRYGIVDLGTLTWIDASDIGKTRSNTLSDAKAVTSSTVVSNIVCSKYMADTARHWYNGEGNNIVSINGNGYGGDKQVGIIDSTLANKTAAQIATALSGVYLIYELAEPTTESADPYQTPQIVDDFGTEEFVTDSIVPVGHITRYAPNLRAKLEMSPNSPDGDGDYIVRQSNGENTYVPLVIPNELPAAPSADGTYTLKVTISNGTTTYSWVTE